MSSSKWKDVVVTGGGERITLPTGQYGSKDHAGLVILSYIGEKETKNKGEFRHSFLVGGIDQDGTCFWAINLRDRWRDDGPLALAFNMPEIVSEEVLKEAEQDLKTEAAQKAIANHTPEDQLAEATEKIYKGIIMQIRINVGSIFRLQDWAGRDRDATIDLGTLVGIRFSGTVEKSSIGESTEIKNIISKKKGVSPAVKEEPKKEEVPF